MLKYANEHEITYDNNLSRFMLLIYFNKLGFTWFDKNNIQVREYHTENDIRKIKNFIGEEEISIIVTTPEDIAYYERNDEKRR